MGSKEKLDHNRSHHYHAFSPKWIAVIGLFLLLESSLAVVNADQITGQGFPPSEINQDRFFRHLRVAFPLKAGPLRINYDTRCYDSDGYPVPFPRIDLHERPTGLARPAAIRKMLSDAHDVEVLQDKGGLVRITVGTPSTRILQTKIHSLKFAPVEQYNGESAVIAITNSKEFRSAKQALGLKEFPLVGVIGTTQPAPGLPHLPPTLNDISVDKALDLIAKKFRGAIVYAACAKRGQPSVIKITFQSLSGPFVAE